MTAVIDIPPITILICIAVVLLFLGLTVAALLHYSGMFYQPVVFQGPPPIGGAKLAYKFIIAPYDGHIVGSTFTEITSIAPKHTPVGIFYDNPQTTPASNLRSVIGVIVEEEGAKTDQSTATMDDALKDLLVKKEFKFFDLPPVTEAVTSQFPYRSPFSIWFAASRVYPLLNQFMKDNELTAYPMLEVYRNNQIFFFAPLDHQDSFFVPEFQDSEKLIAASASGSDADAAVAESDESEEDDVSGDVTGESSESEEEEFVEKKKQESSTTAKSVEPANLDDVIKSKTGEKADKTNHSIDSPSPGEDDKELLESFEVVPEE